MAFFQRDPSPVLIKRLCQERVVLLFQVVDVVPVPIDAEVTAATTAPVVLCAEVPIAYADEEAFAARGAAIAFLCAQVARC